MISKSIILHHKLVDPDKSNKVKPQWEKGPRRGLSFYMNLSIG